ncbi:MAG: NAD-dependent epimerase/dehydratase family protein [Candidatus Heimdallarchaeota archaeon]
MRVLVTGGAGYIGSHLARILLKNHEVSVLDNIYYGIEPIQDLIDNPKFNLIKGDIRDMNSVVKAVHNVDTVIHLASIVGEPASQLNVKAAMEINYLSTKNLIELCNLYDVKKFIFASTCTVYGAQPDVKLDECSAINPIDHYGETKVKSEIAIRSLANMPVTILRLATLFGLSHRMRFDLVVNLFIAKALNKETLSVFGGDQYRPFLHVHDAAEAFALASEKRYEGIYNIVHNNIQITELAKLISERFGVSYEISKDIVDKRDYLVNGGKFNKLFDFEAKRNFKLTFEELSKFKDIKNYSADKYSNYKSIHNSIELQKRIYTLGPISNNASK